MSTETTLDRTETMPENDVVPEPTYRVTLTVTREHLSPHGRLDRTEDVLEVTVSAVDHKRALLRSFNAAEAALPAGEHP